MFLRALTTSLFNATILNIVATFNLGLRIIEPKFKRIQQH